MSKPNLIKIKRNNLECIIEKFPSELASVTLFLPGGTFYELPNQKNLTHLTEHLLTLTPNAGVNYVDWRYNYYFKYKIKTEAYTYKNHVSLTISSHLNTFRAALNYLFDNWLNQNINYQDFKRAKYTVLSEELHYCDNPFNQSIDEFNKTFGGDRKLFANSIEKVESSQKITIDLVRNYLSWTHNSNKAKAAICGNVNIQLIKDYIENVNIPKINSNYNYKKFRYQNINTDRNPSPLIIRKNNALHINYVIIGFILNQDYTPRIKLLLMILYRAFQEIINTFTLSTGLSYVSKTGLETIPYNIWLKTYLQVNPDHTELLLKLIMKEFNKLKDNKKVFSISKDNLEKSLTKPSTAYRAYELTEMIYYNHMPLSLDKALKQLNYLTFLDYRKFLDTIIRTKNLKILFYGNVRRTKSELIRNLKFLD